MKRGALILFSRLPIAGRTKTRLLPHLSPHACAELQWALLSDLSSVLNRVTEDLFVCYTPEGHAAQKERLQALFPQAELLAQGEGNLGARMHTAFLTLFAQGYEQCLLLGSDIPLVTVSDIEHAAHLLEGVDLVLSPSNDGGYWLIGLKKPCEALFSHQEYGTDTAAEHLVHICTQENLSHALGVLKRDLDTWDDLLFFKNTIAPGQAVHLRHFLQNVQAPSSDFAKSV